MCRAKGCFIKLVFPSDWQMKLVVLLTYGTDFGTLCAFNVALLLPVCSPCQYSCYDATYIHLDAHSTQKEHLYMGGVRVCTGDQ